MNKRGVFLILFLFILTGIVSGADLRGEIKGSYGEEVFNHELNVGTIQNWGFLNLEVGLTASLISPSLDLSHTINYRGKIGPLTLVRNQDHFTSKDVFRLIQKDNYAVETSSLFYLTDGIQLGLFQKIPLKNLDLVDASYLGSEFKLGTLGIRGTQLKYSGRRESGQTQVLQVENIFPHGRILAGHGWHENSSGQIVQGRIVEVEKSKGLVEGQVSWRWIDPGFVSALAKTNKITPDRQGWQQEVTFNLGKTKLVFNRRKHNNCAKDKEYNQLSFKFMSLDQKHSVLWRIEPTKAFILTAENKQYLAQLDAWNGTLRLDRQGELIFQSFRWDVERKIIRVELQSKIVLDWRTIGKYDFTQSRSYYYLSASKKTKTFDIKVELGVYDRGNLLAGFNQSPSVGITWGWKF